MKTSRPGTSRSCRARLRGARRRLHRKAPRQIGRVCVLRDHRHRGIGRRVVRACVDALRQKHPGYSRRSGARSTPSASVARFSLYRGRGPSWTGPGACTARWSWRPRWPCARPTGGDGAPRPGLGPGLGQGHLARQRHREPAAPLPPGDARHDHHDPRVDREERPVERPAAAPPPSGARQAPHLQVLPVQQDEDGVAPRRRELE